MRIPSSSTALARPLAVAAAFLLAVSAAGCSSDSSRGDRPENPFKTAAEGPGGPKSPLSDRELRQQAQELYRHAREALTNADYSVAITRYDGLIARYPFSDYSTQAELEKIYAEYKSYQFDEAITAADRFLRAHPRHPHADYIMYLKGVTEFERDQGLMEAMMPNSSKRDIGSQRRAFEDFALLLQRYPTSRYAGDARQRMLFARNRIADHELSVAQFYVTRGAYVAAAKRATDIITEYPGAPATAEALKILQRSYAKAGLEQEARDSATIIAMNSDTVQYSDAPKAGVIAADPNALPPAQDVASAKPGLMSRFAGMFGLFDTTKPENQHTYAVGGAKPAAQDAGSSAATGSGTAGQVPAMPAPAKSGGFSLSSGYQQDATAPVAKPDAAPAQQQAATTPQQQDKPGFFTWFAGLFSSLDPAKRDQPPVAVPPPAPQTPAAKTGTDTSK